MRNLDLVVKLRMTDCVCRRCGKHHKMRVYRKKEETEPFSKWCVLCQLIVDNDHTVEPRASVGY